MATATKPRPSLKAAARKAKSESNGHAAAGAQTPPASDHRVDPSGRFAFGYESFAITLRDRKATAAIDLVEHEGAWLAEPLFRRFVGDPQSLEPGLRVTSARHPSRAAAIHAAGARLEAWWDDQCEPREQADVPAALRTPVSQTKKNIAVDIAAWLNDLPGNLAIHDELCPAGPSGHAKQDAPPASSATTDHADNDPPPADRKNSTEGREEREGEAGEQLVLVGIDTICVNPRNPRKHFDQAELESLAATIRTAGLVQPPRVRPTMRQERGGKLYSYELVAGERRWRAAKLAGLKEIRVLCRPMSDSEAFEATLVENLERRDLNAIEEAEGLRTALLPKAKGGLGINQAELAARFKRDPSWVSNRLRLLELREKFQRWVISQEMPATHARCALAYKEVPESIWKAIEKDTAEAIKDGGLGTVEQYERLLRNAVLDASAPLAGEEWDDQTRKMAKVVIRPTPEQQAALGLFTAKDYDGKPKPRAANEKLARQLYEKAKRETLKQIGEKKTSAKAAQGREPTGAQLKAKAADRAKQLKRQLHDVRTDWLRYLVAKELLYKGPGKKGEAKRYARLELWAWLAIDGPQGTWSLFQRRGQILGALLRRHGHRMSGDNQRGPDTWKSLSPLGGGQVDQVLDEFQAAALFDTEAGTPEGIVPPHVVDGLAALLSIDVAAAWKAEKLGPLTERYFELHNKDELVALGKELDVFLEPSKPKGVMVSLLVDKKFCPLPKELDGKSEKRKVKSDG